MSPLLRRSTKKKLKKRWLNRFFLIPFTLIILVVLLLYYYPLLFGDKPKDVNFQVVVEDRYTEIDDVVIAHSAIIYNLDTSDILYGKNIDTLLPIASISKLITTLSIGKYIDAADTSIITDEDFNLTGNTDLRKGEEWVTKDLLKYSLIESSNRGINAVVRTVESKTGRMFTEIVNEYLSKNNLLETYLTNPTGLDIHAGLSSSESSVKDIAKVLGLFLRTYPNLAFSTTRDTEVVSPISGREYTATNTNPNVSQFGQIAHIKDWIYQQGWW